MSVFFNESNGESYPHYLDSTFGMSFIAMFIISLVMNPLRLASRPLLLRKVILFEQ